MAVSQTGRGFLESPLDGGAKAVGSVAAYARMAGAGLLVALASIVVLYGGSGAIAGTRPDHAVDAVTVSAFYNHPALTILFFQATISVVAIAFFAIAFRRYLSGFADRPLTRQLADFGVALVLIEIPVLVVQFGMQLGLVRLAGLGDPSLLGVFMAWDWIDNGPMVTLEFLWLGALSLAAWKSGALPRWLAGYGLLVSVLLLLLAVPALVLGYPDGINLAAYGPWMVWFLVTGIYLLRGGKTPVAGS